MNINAKKRLYQAVVNLDDYKFEGFIVCKDEKELEKEKKTLKKRGLKAFGAFFYA